jgi:uncharacterized protein YgfB (UPF0149 family)
MRPPNDFARCLLTSVVVAACGSDEAVTTDAPPPSAGEADVATYLGLVYQVDSAGAAYARALADPALTQELCRVANDQYDRTSGAAIGEMLGRADELNDFMVEHDGAFYADMSCTARAMMIALDDHNHTACMWTDLERDRSEADAHLARMMEYVDHAELRCHEMTAGMAGAGWSWSPLTGCQD